MPDIIIKIMKIGRAVVLAVAVRHLVAGFLTVIVCVMVYHSRA